MTFVRKWFRTALGFTLAAALLAPSVNLQAEASEGEDTLTPMAPASIVTYEPSERYTSSVNYTLKANGVPVPVVKGFSDYDYAHFSMSDGPVTYELTILNTDKVHEYSISPKKLGIQADKIEGRTITFTTRSDEYLIVMVNNRKTRMVIAADPLETEVPASSGEGIFNVASAPYHVISSGSSATEISARTRAIQQAIDDASQYGTTRGGGYSGHCLHTGGNLCNRQFGIKKQYGGLHGTGCHFCGDRQDERLHGTLV